jgi:pimeloyl-ACP methyl ester carboxylesterase
MNVDIPAAPADPLARNPSPPPAAPRTPAVRRVRLETGVTLPYVEQGAPDGLPVVMLHGITDSWHSFEPVLPWLPHTLRVFALTQRGHGDADRPQGGYRLRDFAADVSAFVGALGLGPVLLVGHSMGTSVALRCALDDPASVRGLCLIGGFASYSDNAGVVEFYDSAIAGLQDPVPHALALDFQQSTLARPIAPALLDLYVRESLKLPARVWRAAFDGLLEDDFTQELERVHAPTLCVWGEHDGFARHRDQERILAAIEGARLNVHRGAGHALHWEDPARVAGEIAEFARLLPA